MERETTVTYLQETDYRKNMERIVEPYLKKYRKCGWYTGHDGARLFYCTYVLENAKGNIVISHGFTEFSEKYNEIVYYFLKAGYSVFLPEHRGHGRSKRGVSNLEKIHVESFEHYVWDFHIFMKKIVKPSRIDYNVLFAHSMGGAIGALYLEKYPDDFQKAVLSTPMIQMRVGKLPYHTAMKIASLCKLCGFGKAYAAGQHGFEQESFEKSCCLSRERHLYTEEKRLGCRMYQATGADYDWVCAAARASKYVRDKKNIKRIEIPVLVFAAGKDHMVDNGKICKFTGKLKDAKLVWIQNAKHEIFNAGQQEREQFFQEIFEFLSL